MTLTVLRADARRLPLPDESVDLIVTSPPYFALRAYEDGGAIYDGQIGSEPDPFAYLDVMIEATREWLRVLKPSGSLVVNLGDKFSDRAGPTWAGSSDRYTSRPDKPARASTTSMAPRKSLLLLPQRYAIRCVDELGLTVRQETIFGKVTAMPESVTDRFRRAHENVWHFTKGERYYAAMDRVRQPHLSTPQRRRQRALSGRASTQAPQTFSTSARDEPGVDGHPLGALPGSVFMLTAEKVTIPGHHGDDHYAMFPTTLVQPYVEAFAPRAVCSACGEGRRPYTRVAALEPRSFGNRQAAERGWKSTGSAVRGLGVSALDRQRTIRGEVCACTPFTQHAGTGEPSPTSGPDGKQGIHSSDLGAKHRRVGPWREYHLDGWEPPASTPGVVLDPFGGSGTTAHVADALGLHGISVDLSAGYSRIAADDFVRRQRYARVHGLDRPTPTPAAHDALALF